MTEKQLSDIEKRVECIIKQINDKALSLGRSTDCVTLEAVTKTVPPKRVNEAIRAGCVVLGENRVSELLEKYDSYDLSKSTVHFIGHLQTNKVKYIVDKVSMIESVDSIHLAKEIDKQCEKIGKKMDILLEVNIAKEEAKTGFYLEDTLSAAIEISKLKNLNICGLMTIGPVNAEKAYTKQCFAKMYELFVDIEAKKLDNISMNVLSMGMSGDYLDAVEAGATIVRVGRGIFGDRNPYTANN